MENRGYREVTWGTLNPHLASDLLTLPSSGPGSGTLPREEKTGICTPFSLGVSVWSLLRQHPSEDCLLHINWRDEKRPRCQLQICHVQAARPPANC